MTLRIRCNRARELGPIYIKVNNMSPALRRSLLLTIVPKVIRPTSALGGRRDKLMMRESLTACRLSSSWQVSTTKTKIGGAGAGRANWYSIVVLWGWSSGGIVFSVISL